MAAEPTSVSLTLGFQTAFRLRAVPKVQFSVEPPAELKLSQPVTELELRGSCKYLPAEQPCDLTIFDAEGNARGRSVQTLAVEGESWSTTVAIDAVKLKLTGAGSLGFELAPRFPYCPPQRVEPGRVRYDNDAALEVTPASGWRIGTVLTIKPVTRGVFAEGPLRLILRESDEGEEGGPSGRYSDQELAWDDGDRSPQQLRLGCLDVDGPPMLAYRQFGEQGAFEYDGLLMHGATRGDQTVWTTILEHKGLLTKVPFPRLTQFSVARNLGFYSVSGRIDGFAPGLEVPLALRVPVAATGGSGAKSGWAEHPIVLDENGAFSDTFVALPGQSLVVGGASLTGHLVGLGCRAIHSDEPFAAVIDYDETRFTPIASAPVPARRCSKESAPVVALGVPAGGASSSSGASSKGGQLAFPDFCALTFEGEGGTSEKLRKIHHPSSGSGVTIGLGYDMKARSAAQVRADLVAAGVPKATADQLAAGAGKSGEDAAQFVRDNKDEIPALTADAVMKLFTHIYPAYVTKAKRLTAAWDGVWDAFPQKMQEVLVDLAYRGDYSNKHSGKLLGPVKGADYAAFKAAILDYDYWSKNTNLGNTSDGKPNWRIRRRGEWLGGSSDKPARVIAACEKHWAAWKSDCSGFAEAVAKELGIAYTNAVIGGEGRANDHYDYLKQQKDGWKAIADGPTAAEKAAGGWFVIAATKGTSYGHVAVIVRTPEGKTLASGKWPYGYWGSFGGVGKKNQTINHSWGKDKRDKIYFAGLESW